MSEKAKKGRLNFNGLHHPVVDFWRREVGGISSRNFSNRFSASENLVLRLEIYKKLEKHKGCVNTVSFNAEGDVLISGSDDRRVVLWDWQLGNVKLSFHSGHANNVFQAKFMPFSDDRTIVTCAADGMVNPLSCFKKLSVLWNGVQWVLHDWGDKDCIKILKNCKEAVPPNNGKVLIVESVIGENKKTMIVDERDDKLEHVRLMLDMVMMVHTSTGKERTLKEWDFVLKEAGFARYEVRDIDDIQSLRALSMEYLKECLKN